MEEIEYVSKCNRGEIRVVQRYLSFLAELLNNKTHKWRD